MIKKSTHNIEILTADKRR